MASAGGVVRRARDRAALEEEQYGSVYDHRVVTRFIPYLMPHKRLLGVAALSMLAYSASQVAIPWLIKNAIDSYIGVGDRSGLALAAGLFTANAVVNWGANYALEVSLATTGQRILYRLRGDMFSHLQRLTLSFYNKTEVGRLMSRVLGDVGQLQEFLSVAVVTLGDLVSLVGIIVAILLLNVKLGLICMAVMPVLFLIMAVWQPFARKSYVRVRRAIAIVNAALNENISGVRVIQSMNRQERNQEVFEEKNRENYHATLYASKLSSILVPPVDILTAVSIGMAVFFGAQMVHEGSLQVGSLVAFILYIQRFFDPIRSLTSQYTQLQRSMASGVRIFQLMDTQPDIQDAPGAEVLPRLTGAIELRDVSFGYLPGEDVLKKVSLRVEPGETVAVVGPTGAGKTTLVSLLARFYDVERGRGAILVDGHDIRDVTRASLAGQMGLVLQEPFLFSGTVKENIKYNHPGSADERIVEVSRAVGAHDFITRLTEGYDTYLQERGSNLSVGQRQLVSFARAIFADPRILILDEATANIDSQTELTIQRALQKLMEGRTAIVIAHRLSTIRGADKIVVLNRGEIAEIGNHDSLMERDGLYAHLYRMNYAALEEAAHQSSKDGPQVEGGGPP